MGENINKLFNLSLEQLTTLLVASKDGIDISDLCDYRFSLEQLDLLINEKIKGIDISEITNPLIPYENMELLIELIEKGLFTKNLASPLLSRDKLILLIEASYAGIDITGLYNPYIELDVLKKVIELKNSSNNERYKDINITNMTPADVEEILCEEELNVKRELYREKVVEELTKILKNKEDNNKEVSRGKIFKIYKKNKNNK
jgi:hypothetical protein